MGRSASWGTGISSATLKVIYQDCSLHERHDEGQSRIEYPGQMDIHFETCRFSHSPLVARQTRGVSQKDCNSDRSLRRITMGPVGLISWERWETSEIRKIWRYLE